MVNGSTSVASYTMHCLGMVLVSISPVVSVVVVVGDVEGIVVVGIIMHTTWEGSGLHVPLSTHTESGGDGVNPDC